METCRNCGRTIGDNEVPHLFREATVCATCAAHLQGTQRTVPMAPPPAYQPMPMGYPMPAANPRQAAKDKVTLPAIFLIIIGAVGAAGAVLCLVTGLLQAAGVVSGNDDQVSAFLAAMWFALMAVASGFTILGGVKLLKLRGYGLAMAGAIMAMIPCVGGCFLLGLPFGIWAMVVLMKPEVKAAFQQAPVAL